MEIKTPNDVNLVLTAARDALAESFKGNSGTLEGYWRNHVFSFGTTLAASPITDRAEKVFAQKLGIDLEGKSHG